VRNAEDFRRHFVKAIGHYDKVYRPRVDTVRAKYLENEIDSQDVDNLLEAQNREFFIDSLLWALNWRVEIDEESKFPNIIPETQIRSLESNRTRYLDYLGLTSDNKPLLIVETKRPSTLLPRKVDLVGADVQPQKSTDSYGAIISSGIKGEQLSGDWNEWLRTLKDYFLSALEQSHHVPRRVVITNGNWLILFRDPMDAFSKAGNSNPENIVIFKERSEIEAKYQEIFGLLEHQHVLKETPPLDVGEIGFFIGTDEVTKILHGLKILYINEPSFLDTQPCLKVLPVLFVRSNNGAWFTVKAVTPELKIPIEVSEIESHLETLGTHSTELLNTVRANLAIEIEPTTIEDHYENEVDFEILPGVVHTRVQTPPEHDQYQIVTGQHTHYLLFEPRVSNCPHHKWVESNKQYCAVPVSIQSRSVEPRSFFIDGENHHCNHRSVNAAKSSQITQGNRLRCGPRSGREFDPFCEIWKFETRLCCRTCIYQNVCSKAEAFNLPCHLVGE
jgi:hypothetical protein